MTKADRHALKLYIKALTPDQIHGMAPYVNDHIVNGEFDLDTLPAQCLRDLEAYVKEQLPPRTLIFVRKQDHENNMRREAARRREAPTTAAPAKPAA